MISKISDVVSIKTFRPVINLQWANDNSESLNLVNSYIITEELAEHFEKILESITLQRHEDRLEMLGSDIDIERVQRSFIIRGSYGTGKSYFLVVLSTLLQCIYDGNYDKIIEKFKDFPNIVYHLEILKKRNKKLLVVRINGDEEIGGEFDDIIEAAIINEINEEFGECILKSAFEMAVDWLEENRNRALWADVEVALKEMEIDYDELISGLKNNKSEYMKKYETLMYRALGHSIKTYKTKLSDFIKETSELVKKKGYDGIVVIFDELSAYLKASQDYKRINKDLGDIQVLAEATIPRKDTGFYFISSMHVNLNDFLDSIMVNEEDIEKVAGRFQSLQLNFDSGNKLISNLITVDEKKLDELKNEKADIFNELEKHSGSIYKIYYPIHPSTIEYIKSVSEKFAQKERTIFAFIAEIVKDKKMNEPIIKEDGNLNIVTMNDIYDYFIQEVKEKENNIISSINETLRLCNNELERNVVKTLVVARMSIYKDSSLVKSSLSCSDIKYLLLNNSNNIDEFLKRIANEPKSSIYYDNRDDTYEFIETRNSKINLDFLLKEEVKKINSDIVFNNLLKVIPGVNIQSKYTVIPRKGITPIEREFNGQWFSVNHINTLNVNRFSQLDCGKDGTINFIVPNLDEKIDDIDTKKLKEEIQNYNGNICIGIPKEFNINKEEILIFEALTKALEKDEVKNDEGLKKQVERRISQVRRSLEKSIKQFANFSNFKFLFKEGYVEFKDQNELCKYMINRYYFKFPEINVERISGRSSTNRLIDNFISKGEEIVPHGSNKEEHKQIRETLSPLGLARLIEYVDGKKAILSKPNMKEHKNSYEIWNLVISGEYTTKELKNLLNSSPYGLPDFIIEIYLSTAMALEEIRIFDGNGLIQNNSNNIARICEKNLRIEKTGVSLSTDKLHKIKEIWKVFGKIFPSNEERKFDPDGQVNSLSLRNNLSRYMSSIDSILGGYKAKFDSFNISIPVLDSLIVQLRNCRKLIIPEDLFEFFIKIPENVFGLDYNTSLYELEKFLDNLKEFDKHFSRIKNINNKINFVKTKKDVDYIEDLKNIRECLIDKYEQYKSEPFNFTKLNEIDDLLVKLVNTYNDTYVKLHKEISEKVFEVKNKVSENSSIEILQELEKIRFTNLQKVDNILKEMRKYKSCSKNFKELPTDRFINCDCFGVKTDLFILNEVRESIDEAAVSCERALAKLMLSYIDELASLNEQKNDKPSISVYLQEKSLELKEAYFKLMNLLNIDYETNKDEIISLVKKLTSIINEYLQMSNRVQIPKQNCISYDKFFEIIKKEVLHCGRVLISLDDYINIVKKIWNDLENEFDKISIQ